MKQPIVYIIAGPNGAGKTTFAENFLPDFVHCREFLNADLIAAGLSPFSPETQDLRAGRLLFTRIKELVAAKQSFAFETTLFQLYRPLANVLRLYDAAFLPPQVVSHEEKGDLKIYDTDAYAQISAWGKE